MGEYAIRKSDNQEIKIGTCEYMYYIRYEDRNKVSPLPNNTDCSKELNLIWRLPFPSEDHIQIGNYEPFNHVIFGHLPFANLNYWPVSWRLIGIMNTETGLKAVLETNSESLRFRTFTAEIEEIVKYVKDEELKNRLIAYSLL